MAPDTWLNVGFVVPNVSNSLLPVTTLISGANELRDRCGRSGASQRDLGGERDQRPGEHTRVRVTYRHQ